jgi:hypothetical protein
MGAYYYAAGQRVEIEPDPEHVAVDMNVAAKIGVGKELAAKVGAASQTAGVILAEQSALGEETLTRLREGNALQRVYRRNRALIVALPEVRIEFDNPKQRREVMDALTKSQLPRHTITEDSEERIVVKPVSGKGDDALRIANEIYERAHPAAASVRFIQFVPKPSLRS